MSNPFDALNISDDEDEQQFTTTGADKTRKSNSQFISQPTKKEDNSKNNLKMSQPSQLQSILKFSSTDKRKPDSNTNTKGKVEDQSKVFQKDTLSTEEVELEESTDQESKVEDMVTSETPKTKSTEKSMKNQLNQLPLNQLKNSHQLNKQNLNNHKSQLLPSTTKAKVLNSTLVSKRRPQSRVKSMLNG